jgi:hypothetical protein
LISLLSGLLICLGLLRVAIRLGELTEALRDIPDDRKPVVHNVWVDGKPAAHKVWVGKSKDKT